MSSFILALLTNSCFDVNSGGGAFSKVCKPNLPSPARASVQKGKQSTRGDLYDTDRAQHLTSNELVAVKVITYPGGPLDQKLLKEVKVHSALKDKNVLEVLGSEIDQDGSRLEWGGIGPAFFILLEYAAGGDLFDKIGQSLPFSSSVTGLVLMWYNVREQLRTTAYLKTWPTTSSTSSFRA